MLDGQFTLNGYTFGRAEDPVSVLTDGWDTPEYDIRIQDVPASAGDNLYFGRDYFTPPVWTFTLLVKDDVDVYPELNKLATVWRSDAMRLTPGASTALTFRRGGRDFLVYGRPRKFAVDHGTSMDHTLKVVTATFQLADTFLYGGVEHSVTLGLVTTSSSEGLVFPTGFPWAFESDRQERRGLVTVETALPTPFKVHISGPSTGAASDFQLRSTSGWAMEFGTHLSPRGNITVDTSTGHVVRNSAVYGGGITSRVDYRALLQPGPQEVVFTANDPSYTSTATVTWRDVYPLY